MKIGDRVQVTRSPYGPQDPALRVGKEGVLITKYFLHQEHGNLWGVQVEGTYTPPGGWAFYEDELEVIP